MAGGKHPEQVVLVPRAGKTPRQAYALAAERLESQGFTPVRLVSYTVDRDKLTGVQTFLLRVEVEP